RGSAPWRRGHSEGSLCHWSIRGGSLGERRTSSGVHPLLDLSTIHHLAAFGQELAELGVRRPGEVIRECPGVEPEPRSRIDQRRYFIPKLVLVPADALEKAGEAALPISLVTAPRYEIVEAGAEA